MKRKRMTIMVSMLISILMFSLAGCGSKKNDISKDSTSTSQKTEDNGGILTREDKTEEKPVVDNTPFSVNNENQDGTPDFESIIESANKNNLTPEQIAELEADGRENGYEVQWADDGSMIIVEDNGHVTSLNGDWPDNEYTKGVPLPNLPITASSDDNNSLTIIFGSTTAEDIKAYAEELKKAGFTEDAETQDQSIQGMTIYLYSAHNSNGLYVELMYSGEQNALILSK